MIQTYLINESSKIAKFSANIGNKNTVIKTDVVMNELPLLIRKDSMEKINVTIDFATEAGSMLDQNVEPVFTTKVHYAVPIRLVIF